MQSERNSKLLSRCTKSHLCQLNEACWRNINWTFFVL